MLTQNDYEFVKKNENPRIRQEFIDEIDLGEYKEYVDEVRYFPKGWDMFNEIHNINKENEEEIERLCMYVLPQKKILSKQKFIIFNKKNMKELSLWRKIILYPSLYLLNKYIKFNYQINFKPSSKPKIIIFPAAFRCLNLPLIEDFIGIEKYHEGFHTKELGELNELIINPPKNYYEKLKYEIKTELRAYNNQIKNFNNKNSNEYIESIIKSRNRYESKLKEILKNL